MNQEINLTDIANDVADNHGISREACYSILLDAVRAIAAGLKTDGRVDLAPHFGVLKVKDRAARTAHNFATGQPMEIPATKKITFKASPEFEAKVLGE